MVGFEAQSLAGLREIAQALSTAVDLDTTLDLIARKTAELMGVDSCTIYLRDPESPFLRLRATTGLSARSLGRGTLRTGEGLTGMAVAQNRPIWAERAQAHPAFKFVAGTEEGQYESLLAVPLTIGSRSIGALNVQTVAPHAYTPGEIELLALIGDLAAGALSKAQLYERQRAQLDEMHAVAQVSEAITSPQYFHDMLQVVTDMAAQTMNAAVCSLFLLSDDRKTLQLQVATRRTSPYAAREPQAVTEGVLGRVIQSGRLMVIRDVTREPAYTHPDRARREGLRSLLAAPLSVRDDVTGVLCCYTAEEHDFSAEQIRFFSTLANQTALAIENARLATNTAVVREMHHRIKNNLQTVAMLMQLQMPEADKLNPRDVLQLNINRVRTIAAVHELLSEQGFRLVDVRDVVTRIIRLLGTMAGPTTALRIEVTGESLHLPSKEATSLALAVNELVQNAVEHAFVGRAAGVVEVSLARTPQAWLVVVRDDGIGLPEPVVPGLGLEIVSNLVHDDLRGKLTIRRPAVGTEFTLRIPIVADGDGV